MLTSHIQKIKIFFILMVILIIMFIAGGSLALKKNPYLTLNYVFSHASFLKYKIEYLRHTNKSLTANASEIFNERASYSAPDEYAQSIPVLVYHGIVKNKEVDTGDLSDVTTDTFKEHMFALKKAGFETITIDELYAYLRGDQKLPDKSFMLTFDDGRTDSIKNGDPILKALNYEAVMFVITHYSIDEDSNYYVTKEKLKQISKSGRWIIESHTNNSHISSITNPTEEGHVLANRIFKPELGRVESEEEYLSRVRDDLQTSKSKLEILLSKKVTSLAFPFGDFAQGNTNVVNGSDKLLGIVQDIYNIGFYQYGPYNRFRENYHTPQESPDSFYMVRRMHPEHTWSGQDLLSHLSKTHARTLPYTETFTEDQGWISSWGDTVIENDEMIVRAKSGQTGGAAILDGSRLWKDYSIKARVITPDQNNVYVWTRFQDDNNNAGCNFGPGFTHIEHTVNGNKRVLKGVRSSDIVLPKEDFTVEARVKGRTMSCLLNGKEVVTTEFLNPVLSEGGVGFKTWDAVTTNSSLTIKELLVSPLD